MALFSIRTNSRWRPPPFWIISNGHISTTSHDLLIWRAHRAVIFATAQLSCFHIKLVLLTQAKLLYPGLSVPDPNVDGRSRPRCILDSQLSMKHHVAKGGSVLPLLSTCMTSATDSSLREQGSRYLSGSVAQSYRGSTIATHSQPVCHSPRWYLFNTPRTPQHVWCSSWAQEITSPPCSLIQLH